MTSKGFAGRIKGATARPGFRYRGKARKEAGALNPDGTPKVPENPLDPSQISKNTLDDKWLQQETIKQLLITETKRVRAKFEGARQEAEQRTSRDRLQGVLDALKVEEEAALKQIGDYSSLIEVGDVKSDVKSRYIKNFLAWLTGNGTPLEVAVTPWGRKYAGNDSVSDLLAMYPERRAQFLVYLAKLDLHKPRTMQEWMIYYKYFINPINREDVRKRIAKDLKIKDHSQFPDNADRVTDWVKKHMDEFIEDDFLKDWEVFFINDQQKVDDKKANQDRRTQQFYGAHEMSLPQEDKHMPFDVSNEIRGYRLPPQGRPSPEEYVPGDVGPEYVAPEAPERARVEMGMVEKSSEEDRKKEEDTAKKLPEEGSTKGKEKEVTDEEKDELDDLRNALIAEGLKVNSKATRKEMEEMREGLTKREQEEVLKTMASTKKARSNEEPNVHYTLYQNDFIKAKSRDDKEGEKEALNNILRARGHRQTPSNRKALERQLMRTEEIPERIREKQYERARKETKAGKKLMSLLDRIKKGKVGKLSPEKFERKIRKLGVTEAQIAKYVGAEAESVPIPGTSKRRTLTNMEKLYNEYGRERETAVTPLKPKGAEYLKEGEDIDTDYSNLEAVHKEGGKGVFAKKEIAAGRTIGVYTGKVLTAEEAAALPDEKKNDYIFDMGNGLAIDGNPSHIETSGMKWVGIINSPYKNKLKPNVTFSIDEISGAVTATTLRKIYEGEELLARYGSAYWKGTEYEVPDDIGTLNTNIDEKVRERYESTIASPESNAFITAYDGSGDPEVRTLRDEIVDINNILYYSKYEDIGVTMYSQLNHLRGLMLRDLERKLGLRIGDPTTITPILGPAWRSSRMYAEEYPGRFEKRVGVEEIIPADVPKTPATVPMPEMQPAISGDTVEATKFWRQTPEGRQRSFTDTTKIIASAFHSRSLEYKDKSSINAIKQKLREEYPIKDLSPEDVLKTIDKMIGEARFYLDRQLAKRSGK